jgi:hypothetical protein
MKEIFRSLAYMRNALVAILSIAILSGCASTADRSGPAKNLDAYFVHSVLFWLKDDVSAADRLNFENDLANLALRNENVLEFYIGYPAQTERSVVDGSYDVCYVATFDSKEGQDLYQIDPLHLQFVAAHKDIWEKVLVYDSIRE